MCEPECRKPRLSDVEYDVEYKEVLDDHCSEACSKGERHQVQNPVDVRVVVTLYSSPGQR